MNLQVGDPSTLLVKPGTNHTGDNRQVSTFGSANVGLSYVIFAEEKIHVVVLCPMCIFDTRRLEKISLMRYRTAANTTCLWEEDLLLVQWLM